MHIFQYLPDSYSASSFVPFAFTFTTDFYLDSTAKSIRKGAKNETKFETNKRYITDVEINAFPIYFDTYLRGAPAR